MEISLIWHCRTLVVPVVFGALGSVHAGIAGWLDIVPGHHNLQHLQKQCLWDLLGFSVKSIFLDRRDGLSTSEPGFAFGTCNTVQTSLIWLSRTH